MTDPLVEMVREAEARKRWRNGEAPGFSTGICDSLTCGYGELDPCGYWEFPLYPAEKYSKLMAKKRKWHVQSR